MTTLLKQAERDDQRVSPPDEHRDARGRLSSHLEVAWSRGRRAEAVGRLSGAAQVLHVASHRHPRARRERHRELRREVTDGRVDPVLDPRQLHFTVNVFQLNEDGAGEEMDGEDDIATYKEWVLLSRDFHGLWESLVYGDDVKLRLISMERAALLPEGCGPEPLSRNRVVLLHESAGHRKDHAVQGSASSHIRFQTYPTSVLVEVNAHSLFSRWFSESGKLVSRLFQKIQDLLDDEGSLVFVLIDEVESLAAARKAAASGAEPSDAIRVVNVAHAGGRPEAQIQRDGSHHFKHHGGNRPGVCGQGRHQGVRDRRGSKRGTR